MSDDSTNILRFSVKTSRMIGRNREIQKILTYLHTSNVSQCLCFIADGGMGKTRLLEETILLVGEAGSGYISCPIIDLYHSEIHASYDVEQIIANSLDSSRKYFGPYMQKLAEFQDLMDQGANPGLIDERQRQLSDIFVKNFNTLSQDTHKVVLFFDTLESIYFRDIKVGMLLDPEQIYPLIRTWIRKTLPQLENCLTVIAGRPPYLEQENWIIDLELAFGSKFESNTLQALSLQEMESLIDVLNQNLPIIPKEYIPVIHRIIGGRPIFTYLLVDLIRDLSPEPRALLELLADYNELMHLTKCNPLWDEARATFNKKILNGILNEPAIGVYISQLALIPKGFSQALIEDTFGFLSGDASELIKKLENLSFVKKYLNPQGNKHIFEQKYFFHDEFYRLIRSLGFIPNLIVNERRVSHALIAYYYTPQINTLENKIDTHPSSSQLVQWRHWLERMHIEQLYYQLVLDINQGYIEYKRLHENANRYRNVDFGMRIFNEFNAFYHQADRRIEFEKSGISHNQISRENIVMWTERLHWWAKYDQEIAFIQKMLEENGQEWQSLVKNTGCYGNVIALWVRALTMKIGCQDEKVHLALSALERIKPDTSDPLELIAKGRLCTTIGYAYRWASELSKAQRYNLEAVSVFRKLPDYRDELAIVLNNQAYIYARQGRIDLAQIYGVGGLRINESMQFLYPLGLSMTNLASATCMGRNYDRAINYSKEGLEIFRSLQDSHGIIRALYNLGEALRKKAKNILREGREYQAVLRMLQIALKYLKQAEETAKYSQLEAEIPGLAISMGRVFREIGDAKSHIGKIQDASICFQKSETLFQDALQTSQLSLIDYFDAIHDAAELSFLMDDYKKTRFMLQKIVNYFEESFQTNILDWTSILDIPPECCWLLGKVRCLYGKILLKEYDLQHGLRQFVLAYECFNKFSSEAVEKYQLLQNIYPYTIDVSSEEREREIVELINWIEIYRECISYTSVDSFVDDLKDIFS